MATPPALARCSGFCRHFSPQGSQRSKYVGRSKNTSSYSVVIHDPVGLLVRRHPLGKVAQGSRGNAQRGSDSQNSALP